MKQNQARPSIDAIHIPRTVKSKWMSVKQLVEARSKKGLWPYTEGSIRKLIYQAEENGFARCISRVGGRVLIDANTVDNWVSEHKNNSGWA